MPSDPLYIDTGRLRDRITLVQPGEADTAAGLPGETWTTFATPYAYRDHIAVMEQFQAPQFARQSTHRITLRFLAGVTSAMRVSYGGQLYEIQGVDDVQMRHVKLQIFTTLRD